MYATLMPAPFLSVLTDDCIANGRDYNAGGARYNNTYIQFGGHRDRHRQPFGHQAPRLRGGRPFARRNSSRALDTDFDGHEPLRQRLVHKTRKYGNDDDAADDLMVRVFGHSFAGRRAPQREGRHHHVEMLPTTCHVYFGEVRGHPRRPPRAHAAVRGHLPGAGGRPAGPTAVLRSAARWTM